MAGHGADRYETLPADSALEVGLMAKQIPQTSPTLSFASTDVLTDIEALDSPSDDDSDISVDEHRWRCVGVRLSAVFAQFQVSDAKIGIDGCCFEEESPPSRSQKQEDCDSQSTSVTRSCFSSVEQEDRAWVSVGLRLAAVMREAAEWADDSDANMSCQH